MDKDKSHSEKIKQNINDGKNGIISSLIDILKDKNKDKKPVQLKMFQPEVKYKQSEGSSLSKFLQSKQFRSSSTAEKVQNEDKPIKSTNQTASQILGSIYKLMEKNREELILDRELEKSKIKDEQIDEDIMHEELISSIKELGDVEKSSVKFSEMIGKTKLPKISKKSQPKKLPEKRRSTKSLKRKKGTRKGKLTLTGALGAASVITTGSIALSGGSALATLISEKGESGKAGYNAANMGTKSKNGTGMIIPAPPVNLQEMTVGEIMRRQSIQWGKPNENEKLFAVGKYQMIPTTLSAATKALNISPNQKFDAKLQDRMFNEYLISTKNPSIAAYLNSEVDDPRLLQNALYNLSTEWASVADPTKPGNQSHYGSGNRALISVEEITNALKLDREANLKEKSKASSDSNLSKVEIIQPKNSQVLSISEKNKNLKEEMDSKSPDVAVVNNNIISSVNNSNTSVKPTSKEQDKPSYLRKSYG